MENFIEQHVNGYEIIERIGVGGFGAVYRAHQPGIEREVAVKVILPDVAQQPEFIRRFEAEAQLIARLEHMNIVPLYDYWRDPDGAYLVMRWLRGGSLADRLEQGSCSLETAGRIITQVASALAVAHRHNIIHRDIKPANILLDEEGNAYLTDFGIARDQNKINGSVTAADVIVGSLDYISPEQARSEAVTPKTDIYSMGVVLYEMLVGEHPFPNLSSVERLYKHINDPLPQIADLAQKSGNAINQVIQKATAKKPLDRYSNVSVFADAFMEAAHLKQQPMPESLVELLSPREQEVLHLMVSGLSNREIAEQLVISLSTVKVTQSHIYGKLRVRNRVQAIVRGRELDLLYGEGPIPQTLAEANSTVIAALPEPDTPYKGLRAFQLADSQDFFGRETITQKLIERLKEKDHWNRFLAVVGPSGSGKSSLVRAGLVPAIWRGDLPGSDRWFIAEMLPGARPLDELEVALQRVSAHPGRLKEHLVDDAHGLLRAVQLILPDDGSELVLVIDQFEEVFTLVEDEAQRLHFLDMLFTTAIDPRSRVRVIVTLRADFYDRPLRYPNFGEMLRNRMETILPLSADELERAIVNPAERVGVRFEDGLVPSIIDEVSYQPGALPLLQYALTELFERRDERTLTHQAYQDMGGTVGALARRAGELFADFENVGQETVRQMFLRLVTLGEGVEDTRRRTPREELLAISQDSDLMDEVIDTYASYRLLSLDHDPANRQPMVEVAHEAILREWERLRLWIDEARGEIRMQQQLARMTAEWDEAECDPSFLAGGLRLEQLEEWAANAQLALTNQERQFIDASLAYRTDQEAAERLRQEREAKLEVHSQQLQRYLIAVLAVAAIGATALAIFAFASRQQAQEERDLTEAARAEAERRADEVQSFSLIESARLALADKDPVLALGLALQANQIENPPSRVQSSLDDFIRQSRAQRLLEGHTRSVMDVAFSPTGETALSASSDQSLILWDAQSWEILRRLDGHTGPVNDADYSHDGLTAFSASNDGTIIHWDLASGEIIRQFEGHSGIVWSLSVHPEGDTLISGSCAQRAEASGQCTGGEILMWDIQTGEIIRRTEDHPAEVRIVAFSPDGQSILTGSSEGTIIHWDATTGERIQRFEEQLEGLRHLAFNPDGQTALAASTDQRVVQWDIRTGRIRDRFEGHENFLRSVAFLPDGEAALSASEDNTLILWDVQTGQPLHQYFGHDNAINAVALSPNGTTAISAGSDNVIFVWNVWGISGFGDKWEGHGDQVWDAAFSPDGSTVLSGGGNWFGGFGEDAYWGPEADNSLILRDSASGEILRRMEGHDTGIQGVAISPDGQQALSASTDYSLILWDMATGEALRHFEGHTHAVKDVKFSPDGNTAVSGSTDQTLILWDVQTGGPIRQFEGHTDEILAVAFSPDGQQILSGAVDQSAILWDVTSGEVIRRYEDYGNMVVDVAFSSDGQKAMSLAWDYTFTLWNLSTDEVAFRYHEASEILPNGMALTPDGQRVVIGLSNGVVVIWDVESDQQVARFTAHRRPIWRVVLSPDGKTALTTSLDGTIGVWDLANVEHLDSVTQNRYIRPFTPEECEQYRLECEITLEG